MNAFLRSNPEARNDGNSNENLFMKLDSNLILSQVLVCLYIKNLDGVYLWCNECLLQLIGKKSICEVVGKKDEDLFSEEEAQIFRMNDMQAINAKKSIQVMESFTKEKEKITLLARKKPFIGKTGQIIGVIGNSINITSHNQTKDFLKKEQEDASSYLSNIVELSGGSIYWKDVNGVYLGCNAFAAQMAKLQNPSDIIGKTDHDLFSKEDADIFRENDLLVMRNRQESIVEENALALNGEKIVQLSCKRPLYDKQNNIIGTIGNTIDITVHKEAEKLKLETALQKLKTQEQEAFQIIVGQVSHDIRSPLVSLQSLIKTCKYLPEPERIALRNISERITDIANNLLHNYKKFEFEASVRLQKPRLVLISLVLAEILSAKRQKYSNLPIKFNLIVEPGCNFVFIKIDLPGFKRTIANLINNAAEACDTKLNGEVDLKLDCYDGQIRVTLQDNGKGMPPKILNKILNNINVTVNKVNGSGIGLAQVRNTLKSSDGRMLVESKVGIGTKTTLIFAKAASPSWIAERINLCQGDTVVILDDDDCIHDIWNERFASYTDTIKLKHFTLGYEAVDFINNYPEKHKIFLLSDFELIDQELNGIQVIEKAAIQKRTILVTSHHENQEVRELATEVGIPILPKQLALEIMIEIEAMIADNIIASLKKTDLVIIDDDQLLANSVANFFYNKFECVEVYYNPNKFLENLSKYQKDTIICMDYDFKTQINGLDLAEKLHKLGYTKLFLFTGKQFIEGKIPDYLTVMLKGCIDELNKITR